MSVNILNEFVIHFHTFRNIDLLNQGLYQIHTKIFYTDKTTKHYAIPYYFVESRDSENPYLTEENTIRPHNIITNYINDSAKEYISKTFLIRYSDEEVDVDEFCYFRIELPNKAEVLFHLEFELYFSDALLSINKDKKSSSINNIEFKSVCYQVLLLNFDKRTFIQTYMPIIFNDSFSSLLNTSIHMASLDYRMKMPTYPLLSIEESTSITNKLRESINNKKPVHTTTSVKSENKTISLINFFLEDKDCKAILDKRCCELSTPV
jgi:hypothetical protein